MACGRALAGNGRHLVIASVQVVLVSLAFQRHAIQQLLSDIRVASGIEERSGNQSMPEKIPFCTGIPFRNVARAISGCTARSKPPSAVFPPDCAKGVMPPCWPGEEFGAIIGGEDDDGIVVHAQICEVLHDQADIIIELRHTGFLFRPAIGRDFSAARYFG